MRDAWKSRGAGAALIVLLTVVAYLPAVRGGFIWDDGSLITENRMVKAGNGLYRFWWTTEAPDYYPVTWSFWWLEWRLWGNNATGYHVVNVLLHAVNAVLVWLVLQRLKIPGAWLVGLVFAVHPVNVATVAWISEQKNTLSMLFCMLSIFLYFRFDEDGRWPWYGFSLAAFLLALLSKSAVVMLPVVLLGCVWWLHGRMKWKDLLHSMPYFVLSAVLGLVTILSQYNALKEWAVRTDGFASRVATAGWVPWFYLCKAFLPFDLMVIYPKWDIDASHLVSYVPGIFLIGLLALFWCKRRSWGRPLLFGLGYFVVMLFPVLGFFNQGFYRLSLVADHWQYYSIVGAIGLAVAAGARLCRRAGDKSRYLGAMAGVSVLIILVIGTWRRSCIYADSETLWQDNVAKNPEAWMAHYNLGVALQHMGAMQEAMAHWEQAIRIKPDYAEAYYNLGIALGQAGREPEAILLWKRALQCKPDLAEAHYNLGVALVRLGRVQEAMEHWEQALRINPDYTEAHYNLGNALADQGRTTEGIEHYRKALALASEQNHTGLANLARARIKLYKTNSKHDE